MSNCLPTHLSLMTVWMKNNLPGEFIRNMRLVIRVTLLHVPDSNLANIIKQTRIKVSVCRPIFLL
jgi:hypothetical protein